MNNKYISIRAKIKVGGPVLAKEVAYLALVELELADQDTMTRSYHVDRALAYAAIAQAIGTGVRM